VARKPANDRGNGLGFGCNLNLMPLADLLAIDLDFTLLDADRNIPEPNRLAIRGAVEAGMAVVLASGRIASGIRHYADQLSLDTPIVSCNGAFVVQGRPHEGGWEVIEKHSLDAGVTRRALDFCRERGVHVNSYADDQVFFPEENAWTDMYLRRVRSARPQTIGWDALYATSPQKLIAVASPETIQAIAVDAENLFSHEEAALTLSEPEYLEFMSPGCNKGTGVAAVARSLGIDRARTAAIGDYFNDIEMLRWVGTSAAVANAPDEVKRAADHVVAQNDQGGVGAFIDLLLVN
jgi:Cof subfamily protein (haloacid dehalogenase superfamily)